MLTYIPLRHILHDIVLHTYIFYSFAYERAIHKHLQSIYIFSLQLSEISSALQSLTGDTADQIIQQHQVPQQLQHQIPQQQLLPQQQQQQQQPQHQQLQQQHQQVCNRHYV